MTALDELPDEALLKAIAGGAVWAMEQLYQRYSSMLYSLALRMVADHQVAEDLVQEALLTVWRRATSYSPQSGTVRGWLFAILHHRAIDYLRRKRRSVIKEASLEQVELDERTSFPDVWDSVWQSVQTSLIRAALMKLTPEQRSAIELAYFEGQTHVEIAETLQIPLGTVKARLRLGIIRLRQLLMQMGLKDV